MVYFFFLAKRIGLQEIKGFNKDFNRLFLFKGRFRFQCYYINSHCLGVDVFFLFYYFCFWHRY